MQRYKKSCAAMVDCSMFQLSTTMERRNHLHIFLSLSVNSENEVPRLELQKFTSLKLHHSRKSWIVFLHQKICPDHIFTSLLLFGKLLHFFNLSITRCKNNFHTFLQFDCELGFSLTLPEIKCL